MALIVLIVDSHARPHDVVDRVARQAAGTASDDDRTARLLRV